MSARHAFPRCFLQPRTQLRFVRPTLACCGSICSSCDSSCPTHSPFCGPKYSAPQGGWHFAGVGLILRRHAAFLAPVLHLIAACRRMYLFVPIAQARGGMSCLLSHVCQRHAPPLPSRLLTLPTPYHLSLGRAQDFSGVETTCRPHFRPSGVRRPTAPLADTQR